MSTTTTNLSLVKPASNENVDLSVINGNYDKIDQFAGNVVLSADVTASSGHVTGIGQNTVSVVSATGDSSDNLVSLTVDGSTFTVPSTSVGTDTDGWVDDINGNDVFTPSDITITTDSTSGKMDSITINNTAYSLQKISGTENASHYLTSLTIDGTSSNVPQIEANPSGTTTGTLSSIGINGTNYNVSSGGGGASALNDLSDVVVSSPAAGQSLIYDNITNKWQNSALPSGNLADLGDTTITTPTDGQVLTYDSTSSKWVNGAGGGGTTVVANPSGEATEELENLQVGNTIYSIPTGGGGESWTDITGTLTAGQTSITLTSTKIKLNSVIDIYTDVFGVTPQDMQVSSSSVTIKFKPQASDVGVMVRISSVAGVHVYDISLERTEEGTVWFYWDTAYLTVDGSNYGYCLMQKMNQTPSSWTSFGSIGIDLNHYTIPSDLSSIKVHFVKAYLQGYTAVRFMNSTTLYAGGQSGNDAMLRMNGFYQWMDNTVTTGINEEDYTLEISCTASDLTNRYLYIMAADGMIPNTTSGYNNSNEGVFDVRIDGIDFVTGGGS